MRIQRKRGDKKEKCLNPHCIRIEASRGLCSSCFVAANRLVQSGLETWEGLELVGKAKQPKYSMRKKTMNWLLDHKKPHEKYS
jgi:hypothetical protein